MTSRSSAPLGSGIATRTRYCACALKYLMRAGKKSSAGMTKREKEIDDLKKARQYIDMKLKEMEEGRL